MRHRVFSILRGTLAVWGALVCGAAEAVATPAIGEAPPDPPERVATRSDTIVYRVSPLRPRDPVFVYSLGASRGTAASRQAGPDTALVYSRPRTASLDDLIARVARAYRIEPSLVKAVIAAESDFDPFAVSPRGAQGMMQLMPGTARELGVARPFSVEDNVDGGVRYLRWMLDRYRGETDRALAAYNAGPGAVDAHGGVPPYAETQRYVRRVRALHRSYQHAFAP